MPLAKQDAYLNYMSKSGLALLKAHGFRPIGPLIVEVGRWSEITYLFSYESLAEREGKLRRIPFETRRRGLPAKTERAY